MKCRKLIICFGLSLSVFCSLFLSSNTFASSVSCSGTISGESFIHNEYVDLASSCDTSSLNSSVSWYYSLSFHDSSFIFSGFDEPVLCFTSTSSYGCASDSSFSPHSYIFKISSDYYWTWIYKDYFYYDLLSNDIHLTFFTVSQFSVSSGSIDYDFGISDVNPFSDCPELEPPSGSLDITENGTFDVTDYATANVDVSQVSDTPYDDKFDRIIQAIYVCAGTMLVIYFFYCIYRMIIRNSGVK